MEKKKANYSHKNEMPVKCPETWERKNKAMAERNLFPD
jgi:hypothetical protein